MRGVEREGARLDLADREVALGARQALGEEPLRALPIRIRHQYQTLAETKRGLHGVGQPRPLRFRLGAAPHNEAVDDHFHGVLLHLVEGDVLGEVAYEAIDADARESTSPRGREQLLVLSLAVAHERAEDEDARAIRHRADLIDDLLDGLSDDRDPVIRTMRNADPREEKTQVVVDLGDGSNSGSRIARGSLLIDGHRRRKALDEVNVRLFHLTEELTRVSGERLDVPPLAFRVDGVEGEGRFP